MAGALLTRSLAKKDKNGGRAVQKGNVLLAQGGDHLRGIEPMLQPDARAEANKQRQQRRQAGDVIDRHRQDGAIRGGEIQFLRIGVNRAEQVIVGDNRPFRLSGGAGGEHHHRRIVAVNRDRRAGQRFGKAERLPFGE